MPIIDTPQRHPSHQIAPNRGLHYSTFGPCTSAAASTLSVFCAGTDSVYVTLTVSMTVSGSTTVTGSTETMPVSVTVSYTLITFFSVTVSARGVSAGFAAWDPAGGAS